LIRFPGVAQREAIDVLVGTVGGRLDQAPLDLRETAGVAWIEQCERDLAIALDVLEPVRAAPAIQPEEAVAVFEPDRIHLDRAVPPLGAYDGREDFLEELSHILAQRHQGHSSCLAASADVGSLVAKIIPPASGG
jgi:hypothetical protein